MKSKSPKDYYWNYVNSVNCRSDTYALNLDDFYDFFKDLNNDNNGNADVPESEFLEVNSDNELDAVITRDEN